MAQRRLSMRKIKENFFFGVSLNLLHTLGTTLTAINGGRNAT